MTEHMIIHWSLYMNAPSFKENVITLMEQYLLNLKPASGKCIYVNMSDTCYELKFGTCKKILELSTLNEEADYKIMLYHHYELGNK